MELYSEIALSRKPFRIGHMYIHNFFLRMTDTVAFQNIDLCSWDTLYISEYKVFPVLNYVPRHQNVRGSGGIALSILNLGTRWR
jgi:hypothetical protein